MLFHSRNRLYVEVVDKDGRRPPLGVAVVTVVDHTLLLEFLGLDRKRSP